MNNAESLSNYYSFENAGDLVLNEARTRVEKYGTAVLSQMEVLSLVVGKEAPKIWQAYNGCLKDMAAASISELMSLPGVGKVLALRLKAVFELSRRYVVESRDRQQVFCADDVSNLLSLEMRDLEQEHLRVVMLDTKHYVVKMPVIYIGNLNTVVIRVSEVLRPLIRNNASAFVLVHNHPSGDPTPSAEDIDVTAKIRDAAELMDIKFLDHVIIGHNRFFSFGESDLII